MTAVNIPAFSSETFIASTPFLINCPTQHIAPPIRNANIQFFSEFEFGDIFFIISPYSVAVTFCIIKTSFRFLFILFTVQYCPDCFEVD
jgi:hypothetical protein